jgi:N-acetylglutamate synthase
MDRELILGLERCSVRALPPAETVQLGEWLVALGRGSLLRLNSCTTFGESPRRNMFERIEAVEKRYDARGRPTRFRLTELDRHLDERLETRGYELSTEVVVMTGPVGGAASGNVAVASAAGPTWLDRYSEWGAHDELRRLELGESLGALTLDTGVFSSPAAIGVAVLDGPWVGLFNLIVDPVQRRKGHGRDLTSAILSWAVSRGAERSYLQVVATNTDAISMYSTLGFTEAYRYHYRTM